MKVLISADMEGTCGVSSWVQVTPSEHASPGEPHNQGEYDRARHRMTAEVNAAIEGALEGGADEVIVNDSHDGMRNLIADSLHPACRFISGNDKPLSMMQGIDIEGMGCAFFTGYHAKAGTPGGPLAHTWSGWVNDVRFDGRSTGEFGINAAIAGHFGVPITLVAGDEKAVAQTIEWVGDKCVGVAVKEGLSTTSALHLHPLKAQELIREGARQAVANAKTAKPYLLPRNVTVEIDFEHQSRADYAARVPGVERVGERTICYKPADGVELITVFRAISSAASIRFSP
jgi:D-amino peptidase